MKNLKLIFAICAMALVITSCKKGDTGEPGPLGPAGTNGTNGSANVTVDTFTVFASGNINTGAYWNNTGFYYEHYRNNINSLNQSVIDGGAVMLYRSTSSGWQSLPWTQVISTNTEVRTFNFAYNLNQIYISIEQSNGTSQWTYPDEGYTFKLVIIPPAGRLAHPGLNLNNYEEVKKVFGLKE